MKKLLGASIIAMIVFWILNFGSGIIWEQQAMWRAFLSASLKAPIFAVIFHVLHNLVARILGWYKTSAE